MTGHPPIPPVQSVQNDPPRSIEQIKKAIRLSMDANGGEFVDVTVMEMFDLLDHYDKLDAMFQKELRSNETKASGIEAMVCADIAKRQAHGLAKYGISVADSPLELRDWFQHAYEEALDFAVYLRRAIDIMGDKPSSTVPADVVVDPPSTETQPSSIKSKMAEEL